MKVVLLKRIENIVAKEEIAIYEQFLLFPQCFENWFAARALESVYKWERVDPSLSRIQKLCDTSAAEDN